MITVKPADEAFLNKITEGMDPGFTYAAMAAWDQNTPMGYALFSVRSDSIFLHKIESDSFVMADGLARSAFHYSANREMPKVYFSKELTDLFLQLRYIESPDEEFVNLPHLFLQGCGGQCS